MALVFINISQFYCTIYHRKAHPSLRLPSEISEWRGWISPGSFQVQKQNRLPTTIVSYLQYRVLLSISLIDAWYLPVPGTGNSKRAHASPAPPRTNNNGPSHSFWLRAPLMTIIIVETRCRIQFLCRRLVGNEMPPINLDAELKNCL